MTYREVESLLSGIATGLNVTVQYDHGRRSDWNAKKITYPAINLEPLTISTTFTGSTTGHMNDTYSAKLVFYTQSKIDDDFSAQLDAISITDKLRREFIANLNNEDNVILTDVRAVPFFKVLDDCLTGFVLTLNIQVPDNYKYCQ